MNLFVNAISQNWILLLFNEQREIICQQAIQILWNEGSRLIGLIDDFLQTVNCKYWNIENIVVVNWPWSFTWVRTIVLAINTINFINKKYITPVSFFDLFENYPIIKNSSRRDLFVKYCKSGSIEIVKNDDFIKKIVQEDLQDIYWDIWNNILSEKVHTLADIDYPKIIKNIELQKLERIEPLYIKKPSIS